MSAKCCHCFSDVDETSSIKCSCCKLSLHFKCLEMTTEQIKSILSIKCSNVSIMCNRCSYNFSAFSEIKTLIKDLDDKINDRMSKMEELVQNKITESVTNKELIINEAMERFKKSNNLILYNVPEDKSNDDVTIANDILECIDASLIVKPENVSRIGQSGDSGKPRLLRLTLYSTEQVKLALRKKYLLKRSIFKDVFVTNDKTKSQRDHLNNLKSSLKVRIDNGDSNLTIKYIQGIPQIVKKSIIQTNLQPTAGSSKNK